MHSNITILSSYSFSFSNRKNLLRKYDFAQSSCIMRLKDSLKLLKLFFSVVQIAFRVFVREILNIFRIRTQVLIFCKNLEAMAYLSFVDCNLKRGFLLDKISDEILMLNLKNIFKKLKVLHKYEIFNRYFKLIFCPQRQFQLLRKSSNFLSSIHFSSLFLICCYICI